MSDALHVAVCQAVTIMNTSPDIARSADGRRAHDILREALFNYAPAIAAQPVQEPAGTNRQRAEQAYGGAAADRHVGSADWLAFWAGWQSRGAQPEINYAVLGEFADRHRVLYNELCRAVREALAPRTDTTEQQPSC